MTNVTPYEISFKHEILNEFIASVDGFITRNYLYSNKELPSDIKDKHDELWEMYRKLPFESNLEVLNEYECRISEIRDYLKEHTLQPHR